MFTINLNNLVFHAFHGVYEEERLLGNEFVLQVGIVLDGDEPVNSLQQTTNYVAVYELIKLRMQQPTPLLETLAQEMADTVLAYDNRIKSVSISIEKKNPPISQMQGSVSVVYEKGRT